MQGEKEQALLTFNGPKQVWEGEDSQTHCRIWMNAATFERHAKAYLATTYRMYQPTVGDLVRARQHCQQMSYWLNCTDANVHITIPDTQRKKGKRRDTSKQE